MKFPFILVAILASTPVFAAETTFTCEAKSGENVLIEIENNGVAMTITGAKLGNFTAEKYVFPALVPFLEKTPAVLSSLTHVADMKAYGEEVEIDHAFIYAKVAIDFNPQSAPVIQSKFIGFGETIEFNVTCDSKAEWVSPI